MRYHTFVFQTFTYLGCEFFELLHLVRIKAGRASELIREMSNTLLRQLILESADCRLLIPKYIHRNKEAKNAKAEFGFTNKGTLKIVSIIREHNIIFKKSHHDVGEMVCTCSMAIASTNFTP